jgi:hypothetical protein
MPRPPKADRDSVKSIVVGVKFSANERAVLDRLVKNRAAEAEKALGQKIEMSASAYIRWLVAKEATAQGVDPESLERPEPGPVATKGATKAKAPGPAKAKAPGPAKASKGAAKVARRPRASAGA